jgi:hypothetical protein
VLDRERRLVRGIAWPRDIFPGAFVSYTIGFGGSILVSARIAPLAVPVTVDGETLPYEFSETVFRREAGHAPLPRSALRGTRTLVDQIGEVFRRRGRATEDGGRALRVEEVVGALFGPDTPTEITRPVVLALQAGEFEYRAPDYVWFPRVTRRSSPRDRVRIRTSRDHAALARVLAPQMVPDGDPALHARGGPSAERDQARHLRGCEARLPR